MMLPKFGDVFRYRGKDYVFLAKTEDVLYAAQILSKNHTEQVTKLYEQKSKDPLQAKVIKNNSLYYYVILKTENFKDQAAWYGKPGMDNELFLDIYDQLSKDDLREIREEIIRKDTYVSGKLKELMSDIGGI